MTTAPAKTSSAKLLLLIAASIAVAGWVSYYFAQQETILLQQQAILFQQQAELLTSKLKTREENRQDTIPTKPPVKIQLTPEPQVKTQPAPEPQVKTQPVPEPLAKAKPAPQQPAKSQTAARSVPATTPEAKPETPSQAETPEPPIKYNRLLMAEREKALNERDEAQSRVGTILKQKKSALEEGQKLRQQLVMSAKNVERLQRKIKDVSSEIQKMRAQEAERFSTLKQQFEQELEQKQIIISQLRNLTTVINVTEEILFTSGSAVIKPRGKKVLGLIAEDLNNHPDRMISIEGHTDNVQITGNFQYPTNWELSSARSAAAVRYLENSAGVRANRMQVVGHGEHRPTASNETVEGRASNRRIEIILLPPTTQQR